MSKVILTCFEKATESKWYEAECADLNQAFCLAQIHFSARADLRRRFERTGKVSFHTTKYIYKFERA